MYSNEKNTLQLIALLKSHGIKKIVASPGSTNIAFIGSLQQDRFFEIYSCMDERSAAYMACGLSEESGEPVVISCTGATAARNYPSGLTEAFYRKLPVLAVTSSQHFGRLGQLSPQFTDRTAQFNDIVKRSFQVPIPFTSDEEWSNNVKINTALLELKRNSAGPVHINLETFYSSNFSVEVLPQERVIKRYYRDDRFPEISANKVGIFVGSHSKFSPQLEKSITEFCERFNGVVICDQTSNYKGKYRVLAGLVACQTEYKSGCMSPDLLIHIGEVSGAYYGFGKCEVWRINNDGEVRDTFRNLTSVFEMNEIDFFDKYLRDQREIVCEHKTDYLNEWHHEIAKVERILPELPFSNVWISKQISKKLPENSVLYLGILNCLRSFNLFDIPNTVYSYSTVGGFGIDGCVSSMVGASLASPNKLFFGVFGDLATFYDLNILGNRNINNNIRIIVINNATGFEMHTTPYGKTLTSADVNRFFAAGGHNGAASKNVLKHFTTDLGYLYLKAESKEEFNNQIDFFVQKNNLDKPILFEVFVNCDDDMISFNATKMTLKIEDFVYKIFQRNSNRTISIYGAGEIGRKVYSTLVTFKAKINNVFDSNPCGKAPFGDINVVSFDEKLLGNDELIIIASVKFKSEIKEVINSSLQNNKSNVLCVAIDEWDSTI